MDKAGSEWIVPAKRLERELNKELEKAHKGHFDIIVEGHVLCELCLEIDLAVVLKANARVLEKRLLKKKYSLLKALDNLYCEENDYCLKNALHNFGRKKLFVVRNEKGIKAILNRIVSELKKRKFA
jgi:broad-specificity NMP kinase